MRKKRTVTVETHRVLVIRRPKSSFSAWCDECGCDVRWIAPEEAAIFAGVNARNIYRWVERGKLHFTEMADGRLLICTNSLPGPQ